MKVRIVNQPLGCINGQAWPEPGETIDLPDNIAEGMIGAGDVEKASTPAKKSAVEKAERTPSAEKQTKRPDGRGMKVEKATAPKAKVETRKKS